MLMPGTRSRRPRVSECRAGSYKVASGSFLKLLGQRCEEAGTELFTSTMVQGPHCKAKFQILNTKQNARSFPAHSKVKEFKITVAVQPPQSPDVNVIACSRSLQTDVELVAKENRRDLLAAVHRCWEEYPEEKMESSLALPLLILQGNS